MLQRQEAEEKAKLLQSFTTTNATDMKVDSPISVTPKYPVNLDDMTKRFTYHAPKGDQVGRYGQIREMSKALAILIQSLVPPGREQALALTRVEEASMWANAGIARNE